MLNLQLLSSKHLDYPSGSVLNFYNNELYLAGDDAGELLVLDTAFNILRSVTLFPGIAGRIEKAIKADIEAGDFIGETLWMFGSGSVKPHRDILFQYNTNTGNLLKTDLSVIYRRIQESGIAVLNLEAAAFMKDRWLLGNRSNSSQKQNYLVVLPEDFAENQQNAPIRLIPLHLPNPEAGISGMAFMEKEDVLLLTFSLEETANAYDDGQTGDSFLALIRNISGKTGADSLSPDEWMPFCDTDACFEKIKIESVAVGDDGVVYLAADNDDGKSILYAVRFVFEGMEHGA